MGRQAIYTQISMKRIISGTGTCYEESKNSNGDEHGLVQVEATGDFNQVTRKSSLRNYHLI